MPRARSLQAALEDRYGVQSKLVAGHGGVFVVTVNGDEIFDKHVSNRFPDEEEIFDKIDLIEK